MKHVAEYIPCVDRGRSQNGMFVQFKSITLASHLYLKLTPPVQDPQEL